MKIERIGDCTLYLADCRAVLPSICADVMLTDPVWPNCPPDSIPGSEDPWGLWKDTCASLPDLKRAVICMRSDSDPRFLAYIPHSFEFFRSIQMSYVMPGYIGRKLGGDETAYWFGEPIAAAKGRNLIPGRAPSAHPNKRPPNGHPMSRAQIHFDCLVEWVADEGETIIDPFMGSGTTGVACVKAGRPFVGIEVHEPYFEIACERVRKAQAQPNMFTPKRKPIDLQEALL